MSEGAGSVFWMLPAMGILEDENQQSGSGSQALPKVVIAWKATAALTALMALVAAAGVIWLRAAGGAQPKGFIVSTLAVFFALCPLLAVPLMRRQTGLGRSWLLHALGYNALMIVAKFAMGILGLYQPEDGLQLQSYGKPGTLIAAGIGTLAVYLIGFSVIYLIYRQGTQKRISLRQAKPASWQSCAFTASTLLALPVAAIILWSAGPYWAAASGVGGGLLIALLIGVAMFMVTSTHQAAVQSVREGHTARLTSSYLGGIMFLIAIQVVWMTYALLLVHIWPLAAS